MNSVDVTPYALDDYGVIVMVMLKYGGPLLATMLSFFTWLLKDALYFVLPGMALTFFWT